MDSRERRGRGQGRNLKPPMPEQEHELPPDGTGDHARGSGVFLIGVMTPARFTKHGSQPTANFSLSMADRMGLLDLERFGDSTGRLTV